MRQLVLLGLGKEKTLEKNTPYQDHEAVIRSHSSNCASDHPHVSLWNGEKFDHLRLIDDQNPTGRQVLNLFSKRPADEYILLMLVHPGRLLVVELDRAIDLPPGEVGRFFAFQSDRIWSWSIDGQRFAWGAETISSDEIRLIADIPEGKSVFLEKRDVPDEQLNRNSEICLDDTGLERLYSKIQEWELNVQGVVISVSSPTILVKHALEKAGFDPNSGWIVILKKKGLPKEQVSLDDEIDLRTPGIEKIRLTPKEIINGESGFHPRHFFSLLDKDERYLTDRALRWETIIEGQNRWLLLHSLVVPDGYNHSVVDVAVNVPATYPHSQIDMFYCHPHLELVDGGLIGQTEARQAIDGKTFQRWSRHLNGVTRWNPETDSVKTHIAVIEECLIREVEK